MQFRSRHREFTMHAATRLVLGILVCVSVLGIPVPVMHCHDDLAMHGEVVTHVGAVPHESATAGDDLHWHFMLPRDCDGDGDDADDAGGLDAPAVESSNADRPTVLTSDFCTLGLRVRIVASASGTSAASQRHQPAPPERCRRWKCVVLCVMRV